MILYLIIGRLISGVLFFIAIGQLLYSWVNGAPNERLLAFTSNLAEYTKQIVSFVGMNTEERPWPVNPWANEA